MHKKKKVWTAYYTMICAEYGCTTITAHQDPKYSGPCHRCIENKDVKEKYSKLLDKVSKKLANNNEYSNFMYTRAERWSF